MKKTFQFESPNKKPERQVDSIKYEIRKYIARERRKKLPSGVDFWDFDCRIGLDETTAETIHITELNPAISKLFEAGSGSCYIEILAKQGIRQGSKKKKVIETQALSGTDMITKPEPKD